MAPFLGASIYQTLGVHHNLNSWGKKKEKKKNKKSQSIESIMACEIMLLFLFEGDVERCPSQLGGQSMVVVFVGIKKVIAVGFTFNFPRLVHKVDPQITHALASHTPSLATTKGMAIALKTAYP